MINYVNLKHCYGYDCSIDNVNIYLSIRNYNRFSIRVWYEFKKDQWLCLTHKLTEKNNIIIYNLMKGQYPHLVNKVNNYNITTLLLLKEMVNKHHIDDLFPLLFYFTD